MLSTGKLHCKRCHKNDRRIVPALLMHRGDYKPHSVCRVAAAYLDAMNDIPSLSVMDNNPELYRTSSRLRHVHALRRQLNHMKAFLLTCRQRDQLMQRVRSYMYLMGMPASAQAQSSSAVDASKIANIAGSAPELALDMYSVQDLAATLRGTLAPKLVVLVEELAQHITSGDCTICASKGFLCEYCLAQEAARPAESPPDPRCSVPIYPFQLLTVTQCSGCRSFFHTACYARDRCPKCARVERRRRVMEAREAHEKEEQKRGPRRSVTGKTRRASAW